MKAAGRYLTVALGAALAAAGTAAALRPAPSPAAARLGSETACGAYAGLPPGWGEAAHAGMVRLDGGRFSLGADNGYAEERPPHEVAVRSFWIDRTEVTNAQFADFVQATRYVTEAERHGEGVVFRAPPKGQDVAYGGWWHAVRGADWRHPDGPQSSLHGREHEPVVQVTRADAQAYADWLGRSLPTEAEWEYAAKAAGRSERLERGPRDAEGRPVANFWQGVFPYLDAGEDGHTGRAPVGCFAANGFGLHDLIGNVWEWTADPWSGRHQAHGTGSAAPNGEHGPLGLIKGGSFLCATDFCVRYRASARHPQERDVPASHIGFRTVARD
jgi:formylglycine-generating enzyme required for sulfatase activity